MATIPTDAPTGDNNGLLGGTGALVNTSIQAQYKNEPIFEAGNSDLKGYVSLKMYDQVSSSMIESEPEGQNNSKEIFKGQTYSSGKPYVTNEKVIAINGENF